MAPRRRRRRRFALRARAWFDAAFRDYLLARASEPVAGTELSLDDAWQLRRRTIFMDPYVAQWVIWCRIDLAAFDRASFADARRLATDIVLLSNDLGSIDRDREGGASPDDLNLVASHRRAHGWSADDALDRLVAFHNEMVQRYRTELEAAMERERAPAAREFADLSTGVVDGNLASLWTLDFRYRGVEPILERLEWVVPRRGWRPMR